LLEGSDEVCDVESPEQGAEAAAFGQALQDGDVLVLRNVAMEHTDTVSVVQSVQMLQDAPRDAVLMK